MSTINLVNSPGSSHGTASHTSFQLPSVASGAQHQTQQANTPSSTTSALQSTPSPASRPASPASSTVVPSLASSLAVPSPRTTPTKLRTCWNRAQTIAAWVAIAFTIASFVRDYLDITKDSPPSPQATWALQNDFRLSCEYDRRAELRSDACDAALSKSASPPPGISKRALHERRVPRSPELGIDDAIPLLMIFLIAWTVLMSVAIHNAPSHSCEEQPIARSGAPPSIPTKEQNAARTSPSDQLHKQCGGIKPLSRSETLRRLLGLPPADLAINTDCIPRQTRATPPRCLRSGIRHSHRSSDSLDPAIHLHYCHSAGLSGRCVFEFPTRSCGH